MKQSIILRMMIVMLMAWTTPLLVADDPESSDENQPAEKPKALLQKNAPLEELIEALRSEDFSTRMRAVDFIGYRGAEAKKAVPALIETLDNSHMRESALHALKNLGPHATAAIPALLKTLTAYPKHSATRWIAAHALANIGEAAVPALNRGTESTSMYERLWCHTALAKIEGPTSPHLQVLAESMNSQDKKTSLAAVRGLTLIGADAKSVIPNVIEAMDNPVTSKADLAVLLSHMGKDATPAIPQLVILLDHPKAMTRQRAAYALSEIGGPELKPAVPGLLRMLAAKEAYVREMAAKALGQTGPIAERSVAPLIERLGDENEHVRAVAAASLGNIAPTDATVQAALIEAMKDKSGRVRSSVAPVLAEHAPVTKELTQVFIRASEDNWRAVQDACETYFDRLEDRTLIPKRFSEKNPRAQ